MEMSERVARDQVLAGLQFLILRAADVASGEQGRPGPDADASDDLIRWRKRELEELRRLRARFEEIATGVLLDEHVWEVSAFFEKRSAAVEYLDKTQASLPKCLVVLRAR